MDFQNKPAASGGVTAILVLCCYLVGASADEVAGFAAPLNVEYQSADADFSQFHRVLLAELDVAHVTIVPPPWLADKAFRWQVSDRNVARLQGEYVAAMTDQIQGNGGYQIASEPGPGVIELSVRIVSFMPYAEQKDSVTTRGSGEMNIHVELRNAQTGELLAIYEGPQEVGKDYQPNTDFTKAKNIKKLFNSWGRRVRIAMDAGHAGN